MFIPPKTQLTDIENFKTVATYYSANYIGPTTSERGTTMKFEKLSSYRVVPLTLVLNKKSVNGTAIYNFRIWDFVVGMLALQSA